MELNRTVSLPYIANLPKYEFEKPYMIHTDCLDPEIDVERTNIVYDHRPTPLTDLRLAQPSLPFDEHCFKYVQCPSRTLIGSTSNQISSYCKEMITLLRGHVQADKYLCYDMRTRHANVAPRLEHDSGALHPSLPDPPFRAAHVDHTRNGGWDRVARHLTRAEKTKYLNGQWRVRIWNLWRPLVGPVQDVPLAICDPSTVKETDLLACDQVGPESSGPPGEIYLIRQQEAQRWYWLPQQTEEELLIFLNWDSHPPPEGLNFCAHAAFTDTLAPRHAKPRQSAEVRIITFNSLTMHDQVP